MPHESSQLTADEWADLEDRADRFHAALRAGPVADWEPFLGDLPLRLRAAVLTELAILELGHRYGKGESPLVEEYVRRFPELGPADRVPQKLLLEERRCRQKFGPAPTPGEYRNRFPIQAAALGAELDPPAVPDSLVQASTMPSHHMMTMVHEGAEEEEKPAVQHSAIEIDAPDPEHQEKSGPSSSVMSMNSRYELVRVLGSGAFADVWLARKAPSGIEVAVKIVKQAIDKNAAQRELGSLELIKNLRHPYLLATLDYWVSKSKLHIVMELAEGTLRSRMKECAKEGLPGVPREEILPLFAEAAEGLDFLHSKSITHRDVKPDNILILNGHTKVADFGLARQQDEIMASMSFAGTPIYMSPEGWSGKGGPASDQYSLAFAYIEVRQGYCPIKPGPFADVMFAHIEGKFEFADFLEPAEVAVLRKALAREPELRYPSCAAFIEALADACGASYVIRRSRKHGSSTAIGTAAAVRTPPTGTPSRPAGNLMETLIPEKTLGDRSHPVKPPAGPKAPAPAEASEKTVDEWMTTSTVGKPDVAPAKSKAPLLLILAGLALVVGGGGLAVMMLSGGGTGTAVVPTAPTTEPVPPPPPPTTPATTPSTTRPPPTVKPKPVEKNWLPPGAKPAPGAKTVSLAGGHDLYDRIVFPDVDREHPPQFVLIAGTGGESSRVAPFYMLDTKVWAGLYSEYARKHGKATPAGDPFLPVTGVTAADAAAFAKEVFGGALPSADEWDHAAGFYNRGSLEGPTKIGGQPKFKRAAPAPVYPVVPNSDDQSPLGIRDMAGNGREWTRTPLEKIQPGELRILRGRNYTLRSPLTYATMDYEKQVPQTQFPTVPSPYTSFRVTIEIPTK